MRYGGNGAGPYGGGQQIFAGVAAINGGTITGVSGVPYDLAKWDVPVIGSSSGNMGNNGAASGMTALGTTPANAYVLFAAGAIAAGIPAAADFYYCQFSSTTACTVFNNLLSANLNSVGVPLIPASPTAFVTTGPGAFTGVTITYNAVTITIPAAAMGANGACLIEGDYTCFNAATNKAFTTIFGGTNIINTTQTTIAQAATSARIKNRGSASIQRTSPMFNGAPLTYVASAVNTGNAATVVFQMSKATATENLVFEGGRVTIIPT